jgi:hypothetical protein
MVIYEGKISDASEHLDMLDNLEASRLADEIAIRDVVASGQFTEEEARALMSGPEPIDEIREWAKTAQKIDDKSILDQK